MASVLDDDARDHSEFRPLLRQLVERALILERMSS